MKKLLMILAALCLVSCSLAEGAVTEEKALELGGSRMRFPAVSGMADAELQEEVNRRIREDLHVQEYLDRMTSLISDSRRSITVEWTWAPLRLGSSSRASLQFSSMRLIIEMATSTSSVWRRGLWP